MAPFDDAPWIVRHLTGPWHWGHPRSFIAIELVVSVWVVTAGALLVANGYWEGALCFALAALLLAFLYAFGRAALPPDD
jgi:hypothetical protein